jgi:hypothetical protein
MVLLLHRFQHYIEERRRRNVQPIVYMSTNPMVQEEFLYGFEIQRYREQLP